jgi:hypothetical protein
VTKRPLPARTRRPGPKRVIRERIWALLERERAARFPGVEGRIPNFAGAPAAAARLASLPAWRAARVVKSNPQGRTSVGQVASRPARAMPAGADPPIGRYTRAPVEVHEADPHAAEVAERLLALIAASWPGAAAEHVGSSAVPGLPGRGIVDLLLPTNPADIARVTRALFGLGFQRQLPEAFPPTRPMLWSVSAQWVDRLSGPCPPGAELEPPRGPLRAAKA